MRLVLEMYFPDDANRPGVIVAQTMREVEPVIERMIPLGAGIVTDRLTGVYKAQWRVEGDQGDMMLDSLVPNPTPAGGSVVLECFGHNYTTLSAITVNGTEYPTTFVSAENIRTTNAIPKRTSPGHWGVTILNGSVEAGLPRNTPDVSNTLDWVFE